MTVRWDLVFATFEPAFSRMVMYRHGPASAFVHLAQRCTRQCSQRSDSSRTAQRARHRPKRATYGGNAGHSQAQGWPLHSRAQGWPLDGRPNIVHVRQSGLVRVSGALRKQSTLRAIQLTRCRSRQGRSFGEERSHLVLLGFDAAQNLVLFDTHFDTFRDPIARFRKKLVGPSLLAPVICFAWSQRLVRFGCRLHNI